MTFSSQPDRSWKDRTGEIWEAVHYGRVVIVIMVISSHEEARCHRCLILDTGNSNYFPEGDVVTIGEWGNSEVWVRVA